MSGPAKETKPRDARLLHLLLTSLNVPQYEEQIPQQLLTFAHNYVASTLQDSLVFQEHRAATTMDTSDVKLAVAAKMSHAFRGAPPKEFLLELAGERNRRALPPVSAGYGLRLPPEKYCLTAVNWDLLAESDADLPAASQAALMGANGTDGAAAAAATNGDVTMQDVQAENQKLL
ncbi:transcription initiation factor IID, 31kD subunit-domain-containing protein [Protomyces lactucae-debilis]|uniref:Transcription initiation factor IID, 31kD subunit-domain-containing protein n=1 Tax=Protomyces lactucae-debilis TaxID=2754530 RepID=A0A1Y2FCZ8_PROLT|nr:transcription initiation factor IID, 31kD subunit-domain-containing protein [Protomyces lactucae-debilis]ORY81487.1 transcription initiation factor IID, 31kD subunit-domain-containing protein [Protomyces lactucae-debilis]